MNDLLTRNLDSTSFLLYVLAAGPAGGCLHYGARRLFGRAIARFAVPALIVGAAILLWKCDPASLRDMGPAVSGSAIHTNLQQPMKGTQS